MLLVIKRNCYQRNPIDCIKLICFILVVEGFLEVNLEVPHLCREADDAESCATSVIRGCFVDQIGLFGETSIDTEWHGRKNHDLVISGHHS